MAAKYLLPCPCGRQIVIQPRQAGELIPCECGSSVQAPTMLEMATLESAPDEPNVAARQPHWGIRHGVRFLGIVLTLLAIGGGAAHYFLSRPVSRFDMIDPEKVREDAKGLSPQKAWEIWTTMKQGIDRRTDQRYAEKLKEFHLIQVFFGIGIAVGIALIVAGMVGFGPPPPRRPRAAVPR